MMKIDEQIERLMSRYLDGEISLADRQTLKRELESNPAAQALLDEYRQIDAQASEALRTLCVSARTAVTARRRSRGVWLAVVGTTLAAAAALAFTLWTGAPSPRPRADEWAVGPVGPSPVVQEAPQWASTVSGRDSLSARPGAKSRLVDYVEQPALQPMRRNHRVTRDWIGVVDESGNQVYLVETRRNRTTVVPVSADY